MQNLLACTPRNAWPSLLTVSAVGIAASDICVRSFSVAVWSNLLHDSNGPALICVRISKRRNYNYNFSNEQFGSVFVLA